MFYARDQSCSCNYCDCTSTRSIIVVWGELDSHELESYDDNESDVGVAWIGTVSSNTTRGRPFRFPGCELNFPLRFWPRRSTYIFCRREYFGGLPEQRARAPPRQPQVIRAIAGRGVEAWPAWSP